METKRRWAALGIAIAPLFATSPGKVTDAAFVLGRLVHLSPDFLSPAWVPKESNTSNPASNLFKPTKPVLSKSFCKGKGKEGHRLEKDYRVSRALYKSDVLENQNIQECCIRMVVGLGCNTNRCFTWYYWHVLSIDKLFLPCSSASLQPLQKPLRKQPAGASLLDECQSRRSPRSPGIGRSRVAASDGDNFVREQTSQLLS